MLPGRALIRPEKTGSVDRLEVHVDGRQLILSEVGKLVIRHEVLAALDTARIDARPEKLQESVKTPSGHDPKVGCLRRSRIGGLRSL